MGILIEYDFNIDMKYITLHILIAVLLLGGIRIAYAEDNTSSADTATETKIQTTIQDQKKNPKSKEMVSDKMKSLMESKREMMDKNKQDIKDIREEKKGEIKELKGKIENVKEEKKTEMKEKIGEMRDKMKEKMGEIVQMRIDNKFARMTERFGATIEREETIMAKIISRIEKIKGLGAKTEISEKYISEAKTHLDEAKVSFESLKVAASTEVPLAEDVSSSTIGKSKETLLSMRKIGLELEKHLREGHKSLMKAINSLKILPQVKNMLKATTTENQVNGENDNGQN